MALPARDDRPLSPLSPDEIEQLRTLATRVMRGDLFASVALTPHEAAHTILRLIAMLDAAKGGV